MLIVELLLIKSGYLKSIWRPWLLLISIMQEIFQRWANDVYLIVANLLSARWTAASIKRLNNTMAYLASRIYKYKTAPI